MKTKLFILSTLIGFTLLSCHLLQKNKQTLKKLSQKEHLQLTEQRNVLNKKSEFFLIDSSYNDFTIQMWPKGKFTFSVTKGFEGEAESVVINSKHNNKSYGLLNKKASKIAHFDKQITLVRKKTLHLLKRTS